MPLLLPRHSPNSNLFSNTNKNSRFCILSLIFILHCNKHKFYYPFRPKNQKSTITGLPVFSLPHSRGNTHYWQRAATSHVLWHLLPPGGSYVASRLDTVIVPDCLISFQLQVIFFPTRGQIMKLLVWNPQTVEMDSFTEEGDKGTSEQDSQVSWRATVDSCAQGRARYWGLQGHIRRRLTHGPQKLSSMLRTISISCQIHNTHPRKP